MKESLLAGPDDTRPTFATATCDVAGLTDADLATVDDLARLQLIARRLGIALELRDAPDDLRELLDLAGLRDVVRCAAPPTRRGEGAVRTAGRTSPCRGRS